MVRPRTAHLAAGVVGTALVCAFVAMVGVQQRTGFGGGVAVLEDALDAEVARIEARTGPQAAPNGRWHHVKPDQLAHGRAMAAADQARTLAGFENTPPEGDWWYHPTDHVLARGAEWLTTGGEEAPLVQEARRVLSAYDGDAKPHWGDIDAIASGAAFKPVPQTSRPGGYTVPGHEGMHATMDSVNSHVYGQPPIYDITEYDRPYLRKDKQAQARERIPVLGGGSRLSVQNVPSKSRHAWYLQNEHNYLAAAINAMTLDAMRAFIQKHKGKGQNNVVVQMIISQYMKRMKAIAAAKAATATPWQPSPEDAAADATVPEDTGYSKITFQRIDRGVPAEHSGTQDIREQRVRRAAAEAAAVEEQVKQAMAPLQTRIADVEARLAAAAAAAPPQAAPATAVPVDAASEPKGFSVHVPGPVKMDHVELPAGDYSLQLGADAAVYPPSPSPSSAASSSAPASAPQSAPSEPDADEDGYPAGVLNKRKDFHVERDEAAMKQAALNVQKRVVDSYKNEQDGGAAASQVAVEGSRTHDDGYPEGVLNKRKDFHVERDEVAMKQAAVDLQKHMVTADAKARAGVDAASGDVEDDVLDSATGMDRGVDRSEVRSAAESLQHGAVAKVEMGASSIGEVEGKAVGADDVLDTSKHAAVHVDKRATQKAAADLQQQVVAQARTHVSGSAAVVDASDDGDVLNSATGTSSGVDRAAVVAAAQSIEHSTLASGVAQVGAASKYERQGVLDSTTETSAGVDDDAVVQAANAIEAEVAREHARVREDRRRADPVLSRDKSWDGAGLSTKGRFEMLSDTMLMPIESFHDAADTYLDPLGGTEHAKQVNAMYGSLDKSDVDTQKTLHIKDVEDTTVDQPGTLRPTNFLGGVGTKAHLHQVGNQVGAWYSSWWEHPNIEDPYEEVQEMLGLTSDVSGEPRGTDEGKRKLIQQGLNVNGWEPGRTREEVRADHLHHNQVSPGFWNDDFSQAESLDLNLHHPCGSPLRKRPCAGGVDGGDEDESGNVEHTVPPAPGTEHAVTAKADMSGVHRVPVRWNPETRQAEDPIWVDPMPLEVLCRGRNATWCPEETR